MKTAAMSLVLLLVVGCSSGGDSDKDVAGSTDSSGLSDGAPVDSRVGGDTQGGGDEVQPDSAAVDLPGDSAAVCQTGEKKCQGDDTALISPRSARAEP